jgi:hypothetical protein
MDLMKWYQFPNVWSKVTSIVNKQTTRLDGNTSSAPLSNPTALQGDLQPKFGNLFIIWLPVRIMNTVIRVGFRTKVFNARTATTLPQLSKLQWQRRFCEQPKGEVMIHPWCSAEGANKFKSVWGTVWPGGEYGEILRRRSCISATAKCRKRSL